MTAKEDEREKQGKDEEDTEGHGLLVDTDFYLNRKIGRDADLERELRDRKRAKEARPNKQER